MRRTPARRRGRTTREPDRRPRRPGSPAARRTRRGAVRGREPNAPAGRAPRRSRPSSSAERGGCAGEQLVGNAHGREAVEGIREEMAARRHDRRRPGQTVHDEAGLTGRDRPESTLDHARSDPEGKQGRAGEEDGPDGKRCIRSPSPRRARTPPAAISGPGLVGARRNREGRGSHRSSSSPSRRGAAHASGKSRQCQREKAARRAPAERGSPLIWRINLRIS